MVSKSTSRRRERVEEAARALFMKHGYHGTSISDIAADLGVSKAATAYYFPSKDDFPQAIVTPFLDDLENRIDFAGSDQSTPSAEAAIEGYFDAIVDHHPVATWLDRDPYLLGHDDFGGRLDAINKRVVTRNKRVVTRITGGRLTVAQRLLAHAALGGLWRPARENPAADLRRYRSTILGAAYTTAAI